MKLPLIFLATCIVAHAADSLSPLKKVPQNVTELWAGYDPQKEPLRTEVVREWEEDGVVIRYLRYYIGTFKGKSAWMAAFYAFPKNAKNLPGVLHMHGWTTGQLAPGEIPCLSRVRCLVSELGRQADGRAGPGEPIPIGGQWIPPRIMCRVILICCQAKSFWTRRSRRETVTGF